MSDASTMNFASCFALLVALPEAFSQVSVHVSAQERRFSQPFFTSKERPVLSAALLMLTQSLAEVPALAGAATAISVSAPATNPKSFAVAMARPTATAAIKFRSFLSRSCRSSPLEVEVDGAGGRHFVPFMTRHDVCVLSLQQLELEMNMGNAADRGEGAAEELGGKIKKTVGSVIGNEQMEAEGKAKELQGQAKQEAAKAGERTKGAVEEVVGTVKNRVGAVIDNEQMQAEGKAKELTGEARQKANK